MATGVASPNLAVDSRARDLQRALLLTYITLGWMTIEGAASLLLGLGIEKFVTRRFWHRQFDRTFQWRRIVVAAQS